MKEVGHESGSHKSNPETERTQEWRERDGRKADASSVENAFRRLREKLDRIEAAEREVARFGAELKLKEQLRSEIKKVEQVPQREESKEAVSQRHIKAAPHSTDETRVLDHPIDAKDGKSTGHQIYSKEDLDRAIHHCPEVRLRATFDSDYEESARYLEGLRISPPRLLSELERTQDRNHHNAAHDLGYSSLCDEAVSKKTVLTRIDDGLHQIPFHRVNELTRDAEESRPLLEQVIALVQQECERRRKTTSWICYADLAQASGTNAEELRNLEYTLARDHAGIEWTVKERIGASESKEGPKLAYLEGRVYIWQRSCEVANLARAYEGQYFYLTSSREMANLLVETKEALHGTREGGLHPTKQYLDGLIERMFGSDVKAGGVDLKRSRIRAEHLEMILGIIGENLTHLEGRVSGICAENGKGGIENPRFPEGEALKATIARCIATSASDCHIGRHGTIEYYEREMGRIRRFERDLQALGDVRLNPKYIQEKGYYVSYIPSPIGRLVQHYGTPSGNKVVLNPRLPADLFKESVGVTRAFVEDVIPQEGSVGKTFISWSFSSVLNPGIKDLRYEIPPILTRDEVDFIRENGRPGKDCSSLPWLQLLAFKKSEFKEDVQMGTVIETKVIRNPSNLAVDTGALIKSLGVRIRIQPDEITYYEKTGRVSVSWTGRTCNLDEALKLGMIAPPNDVNKREKVRAMICERSEDATRVRKALVRSGLEIEAWWTE